ncbi:hypothetical protein PHYPSEUDO_014059 [Phytophthora pseudosyringae]|uniref:Uncharacterized protein n=1 Tax=Phytophthora pseudosyringae TaxID=221518 RepID=A0A8T1V809_9STRA|nr:hypothetical protein PHYPSEUDO_014059 [Phytophthora pseudosyringae]
MHKDAAAQDGRRAAIYVATVRPAMAGTLSIGAKHEEKEQHEDEHREDQRQTEEGAGSDTKNVTLTSRGDWREYAATDARTNTVLATTTEMQVVTLAATSLMTAAATSTATSATIPGDSEQCVDLRDESLEDE